MAEIDDSNLLNAILEEIKQELGVSELEAVGSGLEFRVYAAGAADNRMVVKVPQDRVFSNANDRNLSARAVLEKEFAVMQYLRAEEMMEIPRPIQLFEANGFPIFALSYVDDDDSNPTDADLGSLLARLHSLPAPTDIPKLIIESDYTAVLLDRLQKRWTFLQAIQPSLSPLPDADKLAKLLGQDTNARLLHMDFRRSNFRVINGEVRGLLDWSNSMIGPPALDIARVIETGEVGKEDFLIGYQSVAPIPQATPEAELLYRFDTALMLTLVFLSESPDRELGNVWLDRVTDLRRSLLSLV